VKTFDCDREEDVLDALTSGRWPERVDRELLSHVANCSICSDVVDVASAVLEVRANEPVEARIPSSAVMWWRAQMRARQEAAREAARPITVAQVVASIAAIVLMIVALVALSPWLIDSLGGWLAVASSGDGSDVAVLQAPRLMAGGWIVPALMIGVWLVLAPVAIYFAVADD
jgi:hypothetical protein